MLNKFQSLPQTRWSYSPVGSIRESLDRLKEAQVIGQQCDACHKVLIEKIILVDGRKFHSDCWITNTV